MKIFSINSKNSKVCSYMIEYDDYGYIDRYGDNYSVSAYIDSSH